MGRATMKKGGLALVVMLLACAPLRAATSFSDDFNSGTLGSNLHWHDAAGVATENDLDLSSGSAVFGLTGSERHYVATNDNDYISAGQSWVATIDVNASGVNESAQFGVGPGLSPTTVARSWGTAQGEGGPNASLTLSFRSGYTPRVFTVANPNPADCWTNQTAKTYAGMTSTETHQFRLEFDSTLDTLTLGFDPDGTGFDTVYTVNNAAAFFGTTDQYIFFGGNSNNTFDNLVVSVVPEPVTMSLLALGGLGLLRRRKK